jgi:hypothetical protein
MDIFGFEIYFLTRRRRRGDAALWREAVRLSEKVFALKGLDILAQGNALGTEEKDKPALKGRDIAKLPMVRQYIPPFQG